jgi:hypothetical protein
MVLRGAGASSDPAPGYWDGSQWLPLRNWTEFEATEQTVQQWDSNGSNVGVLTKHWPAFDLDVEDAELVKALASVAVSLVGAPLLRHRGGSPRLLLAYRAANPGEITKQVLSFHYNGSDHAVEVLGDGQQFVATGTHPSGNLYGFEVGTTANQEPAVDTITLAQVNHVLDRMTDIIQTLGGEIIHRGAGAQRDREAVDQDGLRASGGFPDVQETVRKITNDERFDTRGSWFEVLVAIKGSLHEEDWLDGLLLATEWSLSNPDYGNDPGYVEEQWKSINPPFGVGYDRLLALAGDTGAQAQEAFGVVPGAERPPEWDNVQQQVEQMAGEARAIRHLVYAYSDQELARRFINTDRGQNLLHSQSVWFVWDGTTWRRDPESKAAFTSIMDFLREVTIEVMNSDLPTREQDTIAKRIDGIAGARNVEAVLAKREEQHREPEQFDADPHLLNTPAGVVDLTTGAVQPHDRGLMMTMCTVVSPSQDLPLQWYSFLDEVTEQDGEFKAYLARLMGYCLTGSTREHILGFFSGAGGNGKGVFTNTCAEVMGGYATSVPQGTFMSSSGSRGGEEASPALASTRGSRLVLSSETQGTGARDDAR